MSITRRLTAIASGAISALLIQQVLGFTSLPISSNPSNNVFTRLGLGSSALAAPRYKPRTTQGKAPRRTVGTGSRGCPALTEAPTGALTLLVPQEQIGYTTSGHPTFFWHLSSSVPVTIEFSLVEPGNPNTLFKQEIATPTAGIQQIQLPPDKPELEPGKVYQWTVAMICNPERRSADVIAQALIQREPLASGLENQLASATSNVQKSEVYAENGFWYDALAALSLTGDSSSDQKVLVEDRFTLLRQADLVNVVEQEELRLQQNTMK